MTEKNKYTPFKARYSFEDRIEESKRIMKKYPDRIPVIVELSEKSKLPLLDKNKYLAPTDLTVGQFVFVIRRRMKLTPHQAVFLFVNNELPPTSFLMGELYKHQKEDCGFLYITINEESTFGGGWTFI